MTLTPPLEYSVVSHPGLKRENNEDCYLCAPEAGLWIVADGMGGHEAGEVASAIVRDTFKRIIRETDSFSLIDAIQFAHRQIVDSAHGGIGAQGMGSTIVALHSQKKHYEVAWVGDSRAYLWTPSPQGGHLARLTTDHSYVQMLFTSGAISADEIENHPDKNIITQCLGMQELAEVKVDNLQGQWQKNQWILLCSDGLTDELSDAEIAEVLALNSQASTAVDQLLHEALTYGGNDNITLQIIESPLKANTHAQTQFWNYIPQISTNRGLDATIFFSAVAVLLAILVTTLN